MGENSEHKTSDRNARNSDAYFGNEEVEEISANVDCSEVENQSTPPDEKPDTPSPNKQVSRRAIAYSALAGAFIIFAAVVVYGLNRSTSPRPDRPEHATATDSQDRSKSKNTNAKPIVRTEVTSTVAFIATRPVLHRTSRKKKRKSDAASESSQSINASHSPQQQSLPQPRPPPTPPPKQEMGWVDLSKGP